MRCNSINCSSARSRFTVWWKPANVFLLSFALQHEPTIFPSIYAECSAFIHLRIQVRLALHGPLFHDQLHLSWMHCRTNLFGNQASFWTTIRVRWRVDGRIHSIWKHHLPKPPLSEITTHLHGLAPCGSKRCCVRIGWACREVDASRSMAIGVP